MLSCSEITWAGDADFSGLFAMQATRGLAQIGEMGSQNGDTGISYDQETVRLMAQGGVWQGGYLQLHYQIAYARNSLGIASDPTKGYIFRYEPLGSLWYDDLSGSEAQAAYQVFDRMVLRQTLDGWEFLAGRQPISWGNGRFWQPMDIFGAFNPTELDREYKPGVDLTQLTYYPSPFSSLSATLVFANPDISDVVYQPAIYYRGQIGETAELSLLAARVLESDIVGVSFESDWKGLAWHAESIVFRLPGEDNVDSWFVGGADYQFGDGVIASIEYYQNSRGVRAENRLSDMAEDFLYLSGLQKQLSQKIVALAVQYQVSPLVGSAMNVFVSPLLDGEGVVEYSSLFQLSATYSVADESDLLLAWVHGEGKAMTDSSQIQSEFGHLADSWTLRLRFYF